MEGRINEAWIVIDRLGALRPGQVHCVNIDQVQHACSANKYSCNVLVSLPFCAKVSTYEFGNELQMLVHRCPLNSVFCQNQLAFLSLPFIGVVFVYWKKKNKSIIPKFLKYLGNFMKNQLMCMIRLQGPICSTLLEWRSYCHEFMMSYNVAFVLYVAKYHQME